MLSPQMQAGLKSYRRVPVWLWWVEGSSSDLYAWSGLHTISWDGHDWAGLGHVAGMETVRKADSLEHVRQQLTLAGVDASAIADLGDSVRGRQAKVWLGLLNDDGQIVPDPVLVQQLTQDNLGWQRTGADEVKLTLSAFEALPFVGRATGLKWSHEAQLAAFAGDVGFKYNAPIALTGAAIDWRQG